MESWLGIWLCVQARDIESAHMADMCVVSDNIQPSIYMVTYVGNG